MVLKCSKCGWMGVNLYPDEKLDRALCPKCKTQFYYKPGFPIPANKAISCSEEDEREIIKNMVGCGI